MRNHHHQSLSRHERQRQLNMKLSALPVFTPQNDYQIYHINRRTSIMILPNLIEMARKTSRFTIDTEDDYFTHQPALSQIEMIDTKSTILLIETCHSPHASSVLFWLIKSLVKVVFQRAKTIYSWGDARKELMGFVQYDLFSSQTLRQLNCNDIQGQFKHWYNKTFPHDCHLRPFDDDDHLCTCLHRPVKDKNNAWSLQKAIAYTFDEFLEKIRTKSAWSRCLDIANIPRYSMINKKQKKIVEQLVLYAANDCLAVTKLAMIIVDKNWMDK